MIEDLIKLINGNTIYIPEYDYTTHRRLPESTAMNIRPIILIEGILI